MYIPPQNKYMIWTGWMSFILQPLFLSLSDYSISVTKKISQETYLKKSKYFWIWMIFYRNLIELNKEMNKLIFFKFIFFF